MDMQQYMKYLRQRIDECKDWEREADGTVLASWSAGNRAAYEDVLAQLERMVSAGLVPMGVANHE